MCLIGDFVLTGNEGLKLQATGCLLEREFEGKKFLIIKGTSEIHHCKVNNDSFLKNMNWLKCVPWIILAILWEWVILWAVPHIAFIYQYTLWHGKTHRIVLLVKKSWNWKALALPLWNLEYVVFYFNFLSCYNWMACG